MTKKWEGKSRGTLLGYKIFVFLIKNTGLSIAYFILNFVALYYILFAFSERNIIYSFYRDKLKRGRLHSVLDTFNNFYVFGQTIIDKVAMQSEVINYTFEFDGESNLEDMLKQNKGGIVISAHVGNFEIAGQFLNRLEAKLHLVTAATEAAQIKSYLESLNKKKSSNYLFVKDDMSHIFHINNALKSNELICFTGDRFLENTKSISVAIFGEKAFFPVGPFRLAAQFKVPYSFVFAMKESKTHYHFYASKGKITSGTAEDIVKEYTMALEEMVRKYPTQWFNYYDFWRK